MSSCANCPFARALEAARPFFQELGGAMAGREVTIVPGNHDHRLVEPLLDRVAEQGRPIGLEEHDSPEASRLRGSPSGSARRGWGSRIPA